MKNIKEILSTKNNSKFNESGNERNCDYDKLKNAGYPSNLCKMMDEYYNDNDNITAGAFCQFLLAISDMINKK